MKQKLQALWTYIVDHWTMAAFAAGAIFLFFFLGHFQEIAYALIRVTFGILILTSVLYLWFKDTIRKFLVSGGFVAAFEALEAKHKVATTLSVIFFIGWVVIECMVHA